jgi:predicted RNA binding protein YcfA (HicA-like mRNA interferase family)
MTAREVETILERAGCVLLRQTDHRIWQKGELSVPVPSHRGDLKTGTLRSIIRFAGTSVDEFVSYRS